MQGARDYKVQVEKQYKSNLFTLVENGFGSQAGYKRARTILQYEPNLSTGTDTPDTDKQQPAIEQPDAQQDTQQDKQQQDTQTETQERRKQVLTSLGVGVPQLPTLVEYKKQCEKVVSTNPMANPETPLRTYSSLVVLSVYCDVGKVVEYILQEEGTHNNLRLEKPVTKATLRIVSWRDTFEVEGEARQKGMVRLVNSPPNSSLLIKCTGMYT